MLHPVFRRLSAISGLIRPLRAAAAPLVLVLAVASPSHAQSLQADSAGSPRGGAGAVLHYEEFEAENAETNGTVLAPNRQFGTFTSESSNRSAVQLNRTGQYVKFVISRPANSIVLRYAVPDSSRGGGITTTLGLYINGVRTRSLPLTSRYSWLYGGVTNSTDKDPQHGGAHHFFDETHLLIGEMPAGTTIMVRRDSIDNAAYYVIDLADFEEVPPPLPQPPNSISISEFGATPNDGSDNSAAIQQAIDAARSRGKVLWVPPGRYDIKSTPLATSGITIQGAGMWHSVFQGPNAHFNVSGNNNQFHDFAVFGDVTFRDDTAPDDGFRGPAGTGSRMENVWIEHVKAGWWVSYANAPPTTPQTDGLVIHGVRIRDTFADGVNFCNGTSHSVVEQSSFRSTGDDAVATWSPVTEGPAGSGNIFQFNTVQAPWRANCFAIYGGGNHAIRDNFCADTANYPGILIAASFNSHPFSGSTTIVHNTLLRDGGLFAEVPNGALQIAAEQSPIRGVIMNDIVIDDSTYAGIQLRGPYLISGISLNNVHIEGAGADPIVIGNGGSTQ